MGLYQRPNVRVRIKHVEVVVVPGLNRIITPEYVHFTVVDN